MRLLSSERVREVEHAEAALRVEPGFATSRAEKRMRSKICVLSRSCRTVQTSAVPPETIGAEKLVPSRLWYPSKVVEERDRDRDRRRRARRGRRLRALEKAAARSVVVGGGDGQDVREVRRVVRAGAVRAEFPDAATISAPRRNGARRHVLEQAVELASTPRLRLMTTRPRLAAVSIPWTSSPA